MFLALLLALALQRGLELVLAASNEAQLRRQGAIEVGREHYGVMVGLHAAWFFALGFEHLYGARAFPEAIVLLGWCGLFWGQALRWWTITTLGRRWTTRLWVLPGASLVTSGPFRLVSHPNYLGVWLEIVAVPLIGGCWRTALILGSLHTVFLGYRVRFENRTFARYGCSRQKENS